MNKLQKIEKFNKEKNKLTYKKIEFVRQVIGHSKFDTTSSYVQDLSEKERQERMFEV